MGGEKSSSSSLLRWGKGSPPHGRGKVIVQIDAPRPRRITPAWAGKRAEAVGSQMSTRDHPRMGGEKPVPFYLFVFGVGSPPHGRGKENSFQIFTYARRITPAWAGKSCSICSYRTAGQDHPRMGGEKPCTQRPAVCDIGSPPHGRGKAVVNVVTGAFPGITPAWAGKSKSSYFSCFPLKDHPRMGGEKQDGVAPV